MHNSNQPRNKRQLSEGLEKGDLARLVTPVLHIDEFKSKMGADEDIVVLSFIVNGKAPAQDLMNFVERGYEYILDSDVSSGELDDGQYVLFIEMEREPETAEQIIKMMKDIMNLTDQKLSEWKFKYRDSNKEHSLTQDGLEAVVPFTAEAYEAKFPEKIEVSPDRHDSGDEEIDKMLGAMQEAARVPMNRRAPKNEWTESLRVAAGLK